VRGGKTRGRSCCSEGAVVLPAIKTHAQLDALWADQSDRSAKVLRENARKFNNALALSYNDAVEPFDEEESERCNLSVVFQRWLERAVCEGRAIRDAIVGRSIINDVKHESLHIHRPRVSRGRRATSELFC